MTHLPAARSLMRLLVPHGDWEAAIGAFLADYAAECCADMRNRLDRVLVASESDQAARARAVNACQFVLSAMERARDVLQRVGELDEAARVEQAIRKCVEVSRD